MFEFLKNIMNNKETTLTNDVNSFHRILKTDIKKYPNHKEDEIAENVLRKLMTYAIGRELKFRDRTEIQKILKKLKVDGYRFRDMVIEVCKSSIFRQYQLFNDTQ